MAIKITRRNNQGMINIWVFSFNGRKIWSHDSWKSVTDYEECEICGEIINKKYVDIIDKLKEEGLLQKDYKKICCMCKYLIEKLGFSMCPDCNYHIRADGDNIWHCGKCKKVYIIRGVIL